MAELYHAGKKSKKRRGRKKDPHAGLKPSRHPRIRHEYLDFTEYVSQLNDEEKAWLGKFIDEYMGATLAPANKPNEWRKDFHASKKQRKACQGRVNALNRDLFTAMKLRGNIDPIDLVTLDNPNNPKEYEDFLITLIDASNDEDKKE